MLSRVVRGESGNMRWYWAPLSYQEHIEGIARCDQGAKSCKD